MATRNGYVQIKDLIKQGKLTEEKSYKQGFLSKVERKDKAGFFEIELHNNRVYFYAKFFGHALPFRQYRINRKTTLHELFEEVENWKY
jgi:hypothetical protein